MWGFGIFAVETGLFWIVLWWAALVIGGLVGLVRICADASQDRFGSATFWAVVVLALVHVLGVFDVVSGVVHYWPWLLVGFAVYLILAFPYARFEWRSLLRKEYAKREISIEEMRKSARRHLRYEFAKGKSRISEVVDHRDLTDADWKAALERENLLQYWETAYPEGKFETEVNARFEQLLSESDLSKPISARDYKARIVGWCCYWPFLLLHRILFKWILDFFNQIRKLFSAIVEWGMRLLQGDSDAQFKKFQERTRGSSSQK